MKGKDVTELINILLDKKYLSGTYVVGESLYDEIIEKVVIQFQKDMELEADGIVGSVTVLHLKKKAND